MKKALFGILILLASKSLLISQGEFLIEINTINGQYKKIGNNISGITWVNPHVRAYDHKNHRYFLTGGELNVDNLYTLDVKNGNILHRCNTTNPNYRLFGFKFDPLTNKMHSLLSNIINAQFILGSANISDCTYTIPTSTISNLSSVNQGAMTYDENNKRFFIHSGNEIYIVDAISGLIITRINIKVNTGDRISNFEYHTKLNKVFGLCSENRNTYLCEINSSTGEVTRVGNSFGTQIFGGHGTIDYYNDRYHFFNFEGPDYYIGSINLKNGELISYTKLPFDQGDNLHSIEFDSELNKLFAIHWDAKIDYIKPIANFSSNKISGCVPLTIQFNNLSLNQDAIRWHFPGGNPNISYDSNPIIHYESAGAYDVILYALTSTHSDVLEKKAYINAKDTIKNIKIVHKINALKAEFSVTSNEIKNPIWDFGDNSPISTESNPIHNYKSEGDYLITLKFSTDCGESKITKLISVLLIPRVNFNSSHKSICYGDPVQFIDLSSNDVISWEWQFENGFPSVSNIQNPVIRFNKTGKATVKLKVTNNNGENSLTQLAYIDVKSPIKCPKKPKSKTKIPTTIDLIQE